MNHASRQYWDGISDLYQSQTVISSSDFHYGPLLPGETVMQLLPQQLQGLNCLELGAGAGQNSVFLASAGCSCTALDLSARQMAVGRRLAHKHDAAVNFVQGSMDAVPLSSAAFDLVHSTYALPFCQQQEIAIKECARLLRPGGVLLLTTAHPVAAGEWLLCDDDDTGIYLTNYFSPPPDCRSLDKGTGTGETAARAVPISTVFSWLSEAGFTVDKLLEPQPVDIRAMTAAEIARQVPYYSPLWIDKFAELSAVPFVLIIRAFKNAQ